MNSRIRVAMQGMIGAFMIGVTWLLVSSVIGLAYPPFTTVIAILFWTIAVGTIVGFGASHLNAKGLKAGVAGALAVIIAVSVAIALERVLSGEDSSHHFDATATVLLLLASSIVGMGTALLIISGISFARR